MVFGFRGSSITPEEGSTVVNILSFIKTKGGTQGEEGIKKV